MGRFSSLCATFLVIWAPSCAAFSIVGRNAFFSLPPTSSAAQRKSPTRLWEESSNEGSKSKELPPNIVDKDTLVGACETLQKELEKSGSPHNTPLTLEDLQDKDTFFAIGRLSLNLDIQESPGLDLAESTGLVLVSGVSGKAEEAGIQVGDTIVGVTTVGKSKGTKGLGLDETAQILMIAVKHALDKEQPEIELELNRLMKMRYA